MRSSQILDSAESSVRGGAVIEAQRILKKLTVRRLSLREKTRAASLARRCGLPHLAVKWLYPDVYSKGRFSSGCEPSLLLEYGASLILAGAQFEGRKILEQISDQHRVQAKFFTAFSYIKEWNYEGAQTMLEEFLAAPGGVLDPYQAKVAKINLLAAKVRLSPDDPATEDYLLQLLLETSRPEFKRLRLNALELGVQLYVNKNNISLARKYMSEGSKAKPPAGSVEHLFWQKWNCLIEYLEGKKQSEAPLLKIRRQALEFGHGETLRDADLRLALHKKDNLLFDHVYLGTPFPAYRKYAEREYKHAFSTEFCLPERHSFGAEKIGYSPRVDAGAHNQLFLDRGSVMNFDRNEEVPVLDARKLVFKILRVLCDDFYQNKNMIELAAHVYPQSSFNPEHSSQGIFQLLKRLKAFSAKHDLALRVVQEKGKYRIFSDRTIFLLEPARAAEILAPREHSLLGIFRNSLDHRFVRSELESLTGLSARTLNRQLKALLDAKEIIRIGEGPSSCYLLPASTD